MNSISLENFLDQMVSRSEELAWTVEYGVVHITTKATAGGANYMKVERKNGLVHLVIKVNGVRESGFYYPVATELSNSVRLVRNARQLSGYIWDGSEWQKLQIIGYDWFRVADVTHR